MMIGSRETVDHAEKIRGFMAEADRRQMTVAAVCEHQDDEQLGYDLTRRLLREHPEVRGLYLGTDNFCGIHRALAEHGAGHLKVVATGLFPEVRQAMDQGLVHFALDQRMAEQGELAVQQLHDLLSGRPPAAQRVSVPPLIAVRSNIELLAGLAESRTPPFVPGKTGRKRPS
jgi:ABC-type sugar transport system substrate-binding protein